MRNKKENKEVLKSLPKHKGPYVILHCLNGFNQKATVSMNLHKHTINLHNQWLFILVDLTINRKFTVVWILI